ncbi:phosphoglucosamine mutase [Thiobacillus denitrificans ATCC 25259]|uniref:Phosphoglucosamine mutase n=1 Tax=Thiobacillus denitrificans (strain ATCC 25259 / T1) TaxID=292415 RepID=GLMM_THIDA|nr:phosphoglucosamine mutase [Thiobacillus denitrificans]Q3SJR2.1 RecName: Full=Phosphoglucosamine mutase [Thiobacillus denitrificans ATCC 25259]AAZ97088.1 phosphoglucosamine mutase [Thiobacillus denitrificans ATCC 25259]
MGRKYFGTDGVRGKVGETPITPEFVMRLGYAAGKVLVSDRGSLPANEHPTVLIGKDTRISGYMLEAALEAGFTAAGVNVLMTGPMPTPAVAYLTRALRLQAGVVISASHNPFEDNGIKFFSASGQKLPDSVEEAIEAALDQPLATVAARQLGRARRIEDAAARYIEFCKSTFPNRLDLRGMRIVVDCAHGATYHVAPHVLHELGAEVVAIGNEPNGFNINEACGATHTPALADAVRAHHADIGISLDGDGDRLMMADAHGRIYDGDQLVYVIARHRLETGYMKGGVVGTLMTNLGTEHALARIHVPFERAKVGDRYVLKRLHANGWFLGGETSGHILCLDKHTTGDGIVSSLQVLRALRETGKTLDAFTADLETYPQVMINVPVVKGFRLSDAAAVTVAVADAESALNGSGRIVLRASGTEPLIRVMVEGRDGDLVRRTAEMIADAVRAAAAASDIAV